jgi:arylsulfatase A-like enzyme
MLDIAPTLLELGGYDIPTSMQGKSLMAGQTIDPNARGGISSEREEIIRDWLSGLAYIS